MISRRVSAFLLGLVNAVWLTAMARTRTPTSGWAMLAAALLGFGSGYGIGWWASGLVRQARHAMAHRPGGAAPVD